MDGPEFQADERLKTKRQPPAKAEPRADGAGGPHLLSSIGNAGVQRLLRKAAIQRQVAGGENVDDDIAHAIQAKRGTGQGLDESARRDLEPALGADFSDVRVHTDAEADSLNRAVSAEAFTTGHDIFFRKGSYNPGSAEGQKLLAHELTHVVQQQDAPPAQDFTVSSPEDASEQQASGVADSLSAPGGQAAAVSREAEPEEDELQMSRLDRADAMEEEEEPLQMSRLDRADAMEEEEEPLQMSRLDRADALEEEEEPLQMSRIERADTPEEEKHLA